MKGDIPVRPTPLPAPTITKKVAYRETTDVPDARQGFTALLIDRVCRYMDAPQTPQDRRAISAATPLHPSKDKGEDMHSQQEILHRFHCPAASIHLLPSADLFHSIRIIVVDDDQDIRETAVAILSENPLYRVDSAVTAGQALKVFGLTNKPNLKPAIANALTVLLATTPESVTLWCAECQHLSERYYRSILGEQNEPVL